MHYYYHLKMKYQTSTIIERERERESERYRERFIAIYHNIYCVYIYINIPNIYIYMLWHYLKKKEACEGRIIIIIYNNIKYIEGEW